jgi:hypothetical protein
MSVVPCMRACMHGMSRARTQELDPQAASLDAGNPEALWGDAAIACRGDRNENDARLSAPKGTDQPPYARCVEFDSDDDGSPEDYDTQYPPPQKWRADFYLAAPGQPPALADATGVGSHLQILEFVRSEVPAAERVA